MYTYVCIVLKYIYIIFKTRLLEAEKLLGEAGMIMRLEPAGSQYGHLASNISRYIEVSRFSISQQVFRCYAMLRMMTLK